MNRRGFLAGMLALGVAPAIVRPQSLMAVKAPKIIVPDAGIWTSAMHDEGVLTFEKVRRAARLLERHAAAMPQDYVAFVHLDLDVDIRRELLKYADRLMPLSTVHVPRSLLS